MMVGRLVKSLLKDQATPLNAGHPLHRHFVQQLESLQRGLGRLLEPEADRRMTMREARTLLEGGTVHRSVSTPTLPSTPKASSSPVRNRQKTSPVNPGPKGQAESQGSPMASANKSTSRSRQSSPPGMSGPPTTTTPPQRPRQSSPSRVQSTPPTKTAPPQKSRQ